MLKMTHLGKGSVLPSHTAQWNFRVLETRNLVWAEHLENYTRVDGNALIKEQMGKLILGYSQPIDANSAMRLQAICLEWFLALLMQQYVDFCILNVHSYALKGVGST